MKFDSYTAGTPSWVDLMASDQDAAIAFYCDLFGWECMKSSPDMGNYGMCYQDDIPVAGIGQMPDEIQFPPSWTTYISVDDAAAVVAAVGEAGGQVMADVMDIAGPGDALMGRMAVLADPSGGLFGVWEPHEHIGSGIANEPVSFAWNELLSRDAQASRDFLAQVFGYEWAAMPGTPDGMEYFTAKVDGKDVFGAMDVPAQFPLRFRRTGRPTLPLPTLTTRWPVPSPAAEQPWAPRSTHPSDAWPSSKTPRAPASPSCRCPPSRSAHPNLLPQPERPPKRDFTLRLSKAAPPEVGYAAWPPWQLKAEVVESGRKTQPLAGPPVVGKLTVVRTMRVLEPSEFEITSWPSWV